MASPFPDLILDRKGTDGRVGRITLNRPEKLNALSSEVFQQLNQALHDWEADESVRVIILRGAGRDFSTGYELSQQSTTSSARDYTKFDAEGRRMIMNLRTATQQVTDILLYFWNMGKVTIAEVHGYCVAGGCELAMMADMVVAADDAKIGHPGVRGLGYPRTGVMWPMVLGMRKAKELTYSGDCISGATAEALGMINYAWPADELEARTIAFADRFANMTADHLALLKTATNRWYENMGVHASIRSSTDMAVAAQFTGEAYLWQDKVREASKSGKGLRDAFDWRDGRYGDGRAKT